MNMKMLLGTSGQPRQKVCETLSRKYLTKSAGGAAQGVVPSSSPGTTKNYENAPV
jgi:hypothetical protein